MLLQRIVDTSRRVAEIRGRIDKIDLLASVLRAARPNEIETVIAFLSGAPRQGRIGIGPTALHQARTDVPAVRSVLELWEVDSTFAQVAEVSGKGSTAEKLRLLRGLNDRATEQEQHFLMRLLTGELRQGALEGLMMESVAKASGIGASRVRRAAMATGDLGIVARVAMTQGEAGLSAFTIQLLRPVRPMLAQPAESVSEVLGRLGEAAFEYKLDGARIQVHKAGDDVRVFSRRLREVTHAVPEVVDAVSALSPRELIVDGEVLAIRADGTPFPFQATMRRFGRKLDVDRLRAELPLTPFLFDLLYVEGQDVTDEPQAHRFERLAEFAEDTLLVPHTVTSDEAEARAFLEAAMRRGHEGIMAKAPGAVYAAGGRGQSWLKVKPAHTLDLAVLAAEWGHGRRRGWLSNLHLGARDPRQDSFVMLGKTFKGMTDEMLTWQTERLLGLEISRDRHTVYVRPELVVEVAFNDVLESPHYPGGLALRFARVKRYRSDKTAYDADTFDTVREIYRRATGRGPPAPP